MVTQHKSKRSKELTRYLARTFDLRDEIVGEALIALIGAIHDRLPRAVQVSLVSWVPQSWGILFGARRAEPVRGVPALRGRLQKAGLAPAHIGPFVAEVVAFVERRMGSPLAAALRKRVPELVALEEQAGPSRPSSTGQEIPCP